jgi:hypothetical protein
MTPAFAQSLNQPLVGQAFLCRRPHKRVKAIQRAILHIAVVQTKGELIDVTAGVLGRDVVIDAHDSAFEKEIMHPNSKGSQVYNSHLEALGVKDVEEDPLRGGDQVGGPHTREGQWRLACRPFEADGVDGTHRR